MILRGYFKSEISSSRSTLSSTGSLERSDETVGESRYRCVLSDRYRCMQPSDWRTMRENESRMPMADIIHIPGNSADDLRGLLKDLSPPFAVGESVGIKIHWGERGNESFLHPRYTR